MAELRNKTDNLKVLIFSGISTTERKVLIKQSLKLGAKCLDLKDFKAFCTHVITNKLSKSEKILGALATGKWILHPDYINNSVTAGCWLDEEQYEFCDEDMKKKIPEVDLELLYAPRRWRFLLGDNSFAFAGWKVAVVAGAKKAVVIKRLLISGGASVYNLKLPVNRPEKVADTIGYVFASQQSVAVVQSLFEYGVLCLKPEYIGDYLIKDPPPDIMDYLIQLTDVPLSQDSYAQNSFLTESQTDNLSQISTPIIIKDEPSTPKSPLVGHQLVKSSTSVSSQHTSKLCTNIKKEQLATPVKINKHEWTDVIDLTESDSGSLSVTEHISKTKFIKNTDNHISASMLPMQIDLNEVDVQPSSLTECLHKKISHQGPGQPKDRVTKIESSVQKDLPKHEMSTSIKETPRKSSFKLADFEDAKSPVLISSTKDKILTADRLTSPITRFFKPVPEHKVLKKFDIKEEVQKVIATSTPILKDKTSLINTEKFVKRPRLRVKKRLLSTDHSNIASLPKAQTSDLLRSATKRKISEGHADKTLNVNRRKVTVCEWIPWAHAGYQTENEILEDTRCLSVTATEIIHSLLEEDFTMSALNDIHSSISRQYMPQAKTMKILLYQVLQNSHKKMVSHFAYEILMKVVRLHPPVTKSLQNLYIDVLSSESDDEKYIGSEWKQILHLFYSIMREVDAQKKQNSIFALNFVKSMILQNAQQFLPNNDSEQLEVKHMIVHIIWCPWYHVVFNQRCIQLLDAMTEAIMMYRTEKDKKKRQCLYELLETIIWFVSLITETCRLRECRGSISGINCLNLEKTSIFVHEISKRLIDADIKDPHLLTSLLSMFQLPWLCVGICQQMLDTLDSYLLVDDQTLDSRLITLSYIVKRYLFLLPRFLCDIERKKTITNIHRKRLKQPLACVNQNTKEVDQQEKQKLLKKVNKRNYKGETALHKACIKNDMDTLQKLIKIPGIDVNIKDNAGWTPLHEACNHGHIECVRELLKFVPSKTVDTYFSQGTYVCKKVDILAVDSEGITPLHDAVLNNKVEISRLLLQHGGPRLLKSKTCLGYTALDLANTDEIYHVLNSVLPNKSRQNDSLDSPSIGSQGSTSSMEGYGVELPNEALYTEVLYSGDKRLYSHTNSLLQYIHLVNILINNYFNATDLLRASDDFKCAKRLTDKVNKINKNSQSVTSGTDDCSSITNIRSHEYPEIKKDLQVMRKMPYYVELFRSHLLKLCQPDDDDRVKKEYLSLQILADRCHHV